MLRKKKRLQHSEVVSTVLPNLTSVVQCSSCTVKGNKRPSCTNVEVHTTSKVYKILLDAFLLELSRNSEGILRHSNKTGSWCSYILTWECFRRQQITETFFCFLTCLFPCLLPPFLFHQRSYKKKKKKKLSDVRVVPKSQHNTLLELKFITCLILHCWGHLKHSTKNVPAHQIDTNWPLGPLPESDTRQIEFIQGHLPITGSMYVQSTYIFNSLTMLEKHFYLSYGIWKKKKKGKGKLKILKSRQHIRGRCFYVKTKYGQMCLTKIEHWSWHAFKTEATHNQSKSKGICKNNDQLFVSVCLFYFLHLIFALL